jgi:spore germination cell wall hydrolase CwlJ-like protein
MSIKVMAMISSLFNANADAGSYTERDVFCAAQTVWHEARGQSREEWIAIVNVMINRTKDKKKRWPRTICGVARDFKQFSCYFDDLSDDVSPAGRKERLLLVGIISTTMGTLAGVHGDTTGGAKFYHEKTIKPYWSMGAKGTLRGSHIYYAQLAK